MNHYFNYLVVLIYIINLYFKSTANYARVLKPIGITTQSLEIQNINKKKK